MNKIITKSVALKWVEEFRNEIYDNYSWDNLDDFHKVGFEDWDSSLLLWGTSQKNNINLNTFTNLTSSNQEDLIYNICEAFNLECEAFNLENDNDDNWNQIKEFGIKFFTDKIKTYNKQNDNKNKENGMLNNIVKTAVDDGQEVALRLAAKQLAKSFQEPICAFLIGKLGLENNSDSKNKVLSVLQSDFGLGFISMGLSLGVGSLPLPENIKEQVQKLTKELRIMGEMSISEPVVEMFVAPLRMMLTDQVLSIPLLQNQIKKELPPAKIEMQEVQAEVVKIKKSPKSKARVTK